MEAENWDPATQEIPPNTPNDGAHYLLQSSIGWPTPATVGWVKPDAEPGDPRTAYEHYIKKGDTYNQTVESYFDSYYAIEDDDPEKIYLAFDFDPDSGDDLPGNASLTDILDEAYEAQRCFYTAWRINPMMDDFSQDGLLDVSFYRSVALIMRGNLELEKAFTVRFLEGVRRPGSEEIHDELHYLGWNVSADTFSESHGAWHYFNEASKIWIELFASPIQREILIRWAPSRSLVQDGGGGFQSSPVTVFDGYKDVAVMMRALSQRARVRNEVARRLVLLLERNFATDIIEEAIPALSLEESVIFSILFPDGLPELHAEKYPGVAEYFLAYRDSMEEMFRTRNAALNSSYNALGFDKDLLVIVPGSNSEHILFTYDWLRSKLLGPNSQPLGVLATSYTSDEEARNTRIAFDLKAAEYLTQFDRIEDEYDQQLLDLCGPDPDDTFKPNLTDPEHGGGLLQQQYRNVEMAYNRIESVQNKMSNVYTWIDIERERVWKIKGIYDRKAEMIIDYGDKQADLTEEINDIQADMKFADGMASAAQSATQITNPGAAFSTYIQTVNAHFQRQSLKRIGRKQAKIVKLQAEQQAEFVYIESEIIDANSEAQIQQRFLELRGLEIEMLDAEILLEQAFDQLSQYYIQIMGKVMRRDRALHRLTRCSFADPTYRIEVLNSALRAEDNFQLAQKWVYLTAKALEYKWPVGPDLSYLTEVLIPHIISARTSETITEDMEYLKGIDDTYTLSHGTQLFYWNYSLRKDYLGMTFEKEIPDSGGQVLSSVQQFQQYLVELRTKQENLIDLSEDGTPDHLAVPFSTVCFAIQDDVPGSIPLPDSEGNPQSVDGRPIFDPGLWDDKIDWVQVNIVGSNTYTNSELMPIQLRYGGTGFVRYYEPVEAGEEQIDYRVIPMPHYTLTANSRGFGWKAHPYLKQNFSAKLVSNPREVPADTYVNNNFREHPVAATDWKILIPLNGTNFENIRDIEIVIVHRARTRQ